MENQTIAKEKNDIEKHYPYDIGLALSGGGAKGFAHLGALQALEEKGIRLDIIAGTSAGAIVGLSMLADLSVQTYKDRRGEICGRKDSLVLMNN